MPRFSPLTSAQSGLFNAPKMFSIVITEKGGAQRQLDIESGEVSIGRLDDNDICLPKSNVSKHHARLVFKDDRYVILDQKSTNGTYVNGRRISAPMVVRKGDKIYIGDFILTLAAPGGTFEGVSAREFRPRRNATDPLSRDELTGATSPPSRTTVDLRASMLPGGDLNRTSSLRRAPTTPPPPPTAATGTLTPATGSSPPPAPGAEPGTGRATVPPPRPGSGPPPLPGTARRANPLSAGRIPDRLSPDVTIVSEPSPLYASASPSEGGPPPLRRAGSSDLAPPSRRADSEPPTEMDDEPPSAMLREAAFEATPLPVRTKSDSPPRRAAANQQNGLTSPTVLTPSLRLQAALGMLMERLATEMNVARPEESAFPSEHTATLERLIDELAAEGAIGPDLDRRYLREAAISEAVGLGPLDRLLANRSVREVVIDGPTRILADLGGGLAPVSSFFSDDSAVMVAARRLLHRAGRKFDDSLPVQEARLPAGGFVQLLLPPLSAKGPLVTVRCPPRALSSPEGLVAEGVLSSEMLDLLRSNVQRRRNILVLGPMGSGVSTLLASLVSLTPDHERIVTIENTPSSSLAHPQTLPLSRSARPDLSLDHYLQYASRLRYDRLVIDDLSGPDALAALSAAASSPGLMFGMHAPTPETALLQLELFARAALGGGHASLAPLLTSALGLLVQIAIGSDGNRRIISISELRAGDDDALHLWPLFRHDPSSGFQKLH